MTTITNDLPFCTELQQITRGELAGERAVQVLRQAILVRKSLDDQSRDLAAMISQAEDFLVYGPPGRPGNESYR
jgi:hypothetical protein